jgi:hypothetical protein
MDSLLKVPTNPSQAKAFVAPGSLSYPVGVSEENTLEGDNIKIPPPSSSLNEGDVSNGIAMAAAADSVPKWPCASGIVPTLQ